LAVKTIEVSVTEWVNLWRRFIGKGRSRPLKNQYQGSIEVIQWQDLINEALAKE
jgi:hypothetical protein